MSDPTARDLLTGLLALRGGLIEPEALRTALGNWSRDPSRPLSDHLEETVAVDAGRLAALETLAEARVEAEPGDSSSLDALYVGGPADPDVTRTIDPHDSGSAEGGVSGGATSPAATGDRRFRVLRPHAQGGLGAVFVALDAELNREVALKQILDAHAGNPASRQRFLVEAEITGGLEHPGIVPVYGLGVDDDGRPYYAMRFIRGDTLKEAIAAFHRDETTRRDPGRRSLELRKLLRRFLDVCNAVEYAHGRGVLHRDLKPSNVIVGKHGETLVVDWGLARARGRPDVGEGSPAEERPLTPASSGSGIETLPGSALGTPAYMSPEQARGDLESLSPRSDVYSLGATLYALQTGRAPFAGTLDEVLRRVKAGAFDRPRQVDPTVDAALEAVCLRAMALDPGDRYPSARALADDVERWAADEPVTAWREPIGRRARRWSRRHRTALAVAVAAVLAASVGLGVVALVQTEARNRLDRANLDLRHANLETARARDQAERRAGLALEALGSFTGTIDANLDVKNLPENAPLRKALLQGPRDFYRRLRDDLAAAGDPRPEARASLADAYVKLAKLNTDLGSQADAIAAADEAEAILSALVRDGGSQARADLAGLLHDRAILRVQNGRVADARDDYRRALELREALGREEPAVAAHPLALARILQNVADLEAGAGAVDAAMTALDRSRVAADLALRLAPDDPMARLIRPRVDQRRGAILFTQKARLPEAREAFETAIAALEPRAAHRPDDLDLQLALADSCAMLSAVRGELGDVEAALELERRAFGVVEALGRLRPTSSIVRRNKVARARGLASVLGDLGRNAEAMEILGVARETAEALVAENPTSIPALRTLAQVHNVTAMQQFGLGRVADALASIERGADALDRLVALDPRDLDARRDLAGARYNIGYLRRELGDDDASIASYEASLAMRLALDREFPDDPRFAFDAASTLGNLAGIHLDRDDLDRASDASGRSVALLARLVAAHPENVTYRSYLARNRSNLANVLTLRGQFDRAEAILAEARESADRIATAQPGLVQNWYDLGTIDETWSMLARRQGRDDDSAAHLERAIAAYGRGLEATPGDPNVLNHQAASLVDLARLLNRRGRSAEALGRLTGLEATLDAATAGDSGAERLRPVLGQVRRALAESLARLGRAAEAADAWSRAEALDPTGPLAGLGPAWIAAWSGDASAAFAGAEPDDDPDRLVERARLAAFVAAMHVDPALDRRAGDRAVALLARAAALDHFRSDQARRLLRHDRDWDALRDRPDFLLLRLDLEFPAQPFAAAE